MGRNFDSFVLKYCSVGEAEQESTRTIG